MAKTKPKTGSVKVRVEKKKNEVKSDAILPQIIETDAEREKKFYLRIGVASVMIVFVVLWIFTLKYQFKANSENTSKNTFSWEQTKAELDKAMNQAKQSLAEIKKISQTSAENVATSSSELTAEQINLLKGKLMSEVATSTTASSTIK